MLWPALLPAFQCLEAGFDRKRKPCAFEPFTFSAYQTPDDWKLAQEGKEQLYKEVVATIRRKS